MKRLLLLLGIFCVVLFSGCTQNSSSVTVQDGVSGEENNPGISTPSEIVPFQADGIISPNEYQYEILGNQDKLKIYWRDDGDSVSLGLVSKATGWVAIGFEPKMMMQDADIIIGDVKDGETVVLDEYSTGPTGPHREDTVLGGTSDLTAFGGSEENGITVIEFSRLKDTKDSYDTLLTSDKPIKIIWALADTDVLDMKHNIARGSTEIKQ